MVNYASGLGVAKSSCTRRRSAMHAAHGIALSQNAAPDGHLAIVDIGVFATANVLRQRERTVRSRLRQSIRRRHTTVG